MGSRKNLDNIDNHNDDNIDNDNDNDDIIDNDDNDENDENYVNTLSRVLSLSCPVLSSTWWILGCCNDVMNPGLLLLSKDTWPSPSTITPFTRFTAWRAPYNKMYF